MRRILTGSVAVAALLLSACGYILHPERVGQTSGRLDPAVVLLDAAGCLLFIIPGIVAFAVDFHYGTIYLPAGQRGPYPLGSLDGDNWRRMSFPGRLSLERLEQIVHEELGPQPSLRDPRWQVLEATVPHRS